MKPNFPFAEKPAPRNGAEIPLSFSIASAACTHSTHFPPPVGHETGGQKKKHREEPFSFLEVLGHYPLEGAAAPWK